MKILKRGTYTPKPLKIYRGTCNFCGCQIECEEKDRHMVPIHTASKKQYFCSCPFISGIYVCKGQIQMEEVIPQSNPSKDQVEKFEDAFDNFFKDDPATIVINKAKPSKSEIIRGLHKEIDEYFQRREF